ncbi:MAG: hypothetical protein R3F37_07610 [Candidatus Competibacteraceae bacterium]
MPLGTVGDDEQALQKMPPKVFAMTWSFYPAAPRKEPGDLSYRAVSLLHDRHCGPRCGVETR